MELISAASGRTSNSVGRAAGAVEFAGLFTFFTPPAAGVAATRRTCRAAALKNCRRPDREPAERERSATSGSLATAPASLARSTARPTDKGSAGGSARLARPAGQPSVANPARPPPFPATLAPGPGAGGGGPCRAGHRCEWVQRQQRALGARASYLMRRHNNCTTPPHTEPPAPLDDTLKPVARLPKPTRRPLPACNTPDTTRRRREFTDRSSPQTMVSVCLIISAGDPLRHHSSGGLV